MLEQLSARIGSETGKKIVIRYQMDSAGPHQDATLNRYIRTEFGKRDWIFRYQPSQSPITNVKDDCVFPALSKHVSNEQGQSKGSQVYTMDELWSTVQKCWNAFPLDTLARAYIRHSQIASALLESEGTDKFVRTRGALGCNVRRVCVPVCDADGKSTGVEIATALEADDTVPKKLKYSPPEGVPMARMVDEHMEKLQKDEIQCLFDGMDTDEPWFESYVADAWAKHQGVTANTIARMEATGAAGA